MEVSLVTRRLGLLSLLGGIFLFTMAILDMLSIKTSAWMLAGLLAVVIGHIGFYRYQKQSADRFGRISSIIIITGMSAMFIVIVVTSVFQFLTVKLYHLLNGVIFWIYPIVGLISVIGWLLFGVSIVIKRVFPRWVGIFTTLGVLTIFFLSLSTNFFPEWFVDGSPYSVILGVIGSLPYFTISLTYVFLGWIVWRDRLNGDQKFTGVESEGRIVE